MKLRGIAPRLLTAAGTRTFAGIASVAVLAVAACAPTSTGGGESGGSGGDAGKTWAPERPVTFVVATGVGGGGDLFGRATADGIAQADPKVKIAVENHTGGNDVVGANYALTHSNDPYYMFVANSALLLMPYSIKPPPDFTWKSFTPVAELAEDQQLLVVPANSPYHTLSELVTAAKEQRLRVAVSTVAGTDDACARMLESMEHIEFQHVSLESGAAGVAGLLGGNADLAILNPAEAKGQLDAKTVRALAVFAPQRYANGSGLEDIPTAVEQGINLTFVQFRGLLAPGKITDPQRDFWAGVSEKWTKTQGYKDYIKNNALQPAFRTGQQFTDFLQAQEQQIKAIFGD